jgi:catechol 2,3-dioxygenase-like lactoylglutathione lyase family enzyme
MKIKSVSGVTCHVKSLSKTADFYEALGFEIKKRDAEHVTAYSNWFWIDFRPIGKGGRDDLKMDPAAGKKGVGVLLHVSVEDVDEFCRALRGKGIKPASEPQDRPWGDREFLLRDPDGYGLVIFKRK